MGLSLKGPQKDGADILDEGVMTREVVARYAEEDGLDGNAEAAKVLPARRALWRLCEVYAPRLLAQALAEVLPGETVTATVPGALRIWTVVTASLVAAATSGTDRRQVMILTALLRQISGEAATLAMAYGQSESEAAEAADSSETAHE